MSVLGSACGRLLRGLLALAVALLMLATVAGAGLAWRLSQGPLDLGWAIPRIERAASAIPGRLSIGAATLAWGGFAEGAGSGLDVHLGDVALRGPAGAAVVSATGLDVSLSLSRLLLGRVVPRDVAATGLDMRLLRGVDGSVSLDLAGLDLSMSGGGGEPGPSLADSIAELARPARPDAARPGPGAERPGVERPGTERPGVERPGMEWPGVERLAQLRRVRLSDSTFALRDQARGGVWRLGVEALDLRRQAGGGVIGDAAATVAYGGARARLAAHAELASDGTRVQATLAPLAAADAAGALQQATGLSARGAMEAPVQASATMLLSPTLRPVSATLHAEAGAGLARVAGAEIGFDALALDADAAWDQPVWDRPAKVAVRGAKVVLRPPGAGRPTILLASGQAEARRNGIVATVQASLDQLAFADLGSLWPARLGGHVRPWLVDNITAGTARDGTIRLGLEASADLAHLAVTSADGSLAGEDVTIWWLRPAPPIEHARALLTITRPDRLTIAVPSARQGPMALKDGVVEITGLTVRDQFLTVSADASGGVAELLALLKHPRLRLLDRKPIPMRGPAGSFSGRLGVSLPLNHDLDFDDVKIDAQARVGGLRLGGLVAGRDLDHGDVKVHATSEMFTASGTAAVGGIPAEIAVEMDFKPGPPDQVVERAQATGRVTAPQLAAIGLDPGGLIEKGSGAFTARYVQRRDTTAELQVNADLRGAALALPGWRKPPGQPAEMSARVLLRDDKLVGIDRLRARGPGMAIEGRGELIGAAPRLLVLDSVVLGRTRARGQVRFPDKPGGAIRATLSGAVLDLSDAVSSASARPPAEGGDSDTPWVADVRFDRVMLSDGGGVSGVTAHAEHDGRRLASLRATSNGPERLVATVRPEAAGRRVVVRSADGGALLRALDLVDTVQGGQLSLDARYDDGRPDPPLAGTAELREFHVRQAPVLGKLLQALTIYGLGDALSGPGLFFTDLVLPFRLGGPVLDITDARAFSASLGLTAKGRIDTKRQVIDLKGTVVPAYVVNSALGRIPLLGRLFRNEQGGGLVALDYGLRGPLGDPSVVVNPLSALTPGFLRGLFHIFD